MLRSYVKGALSYVLPAARNSHTDRFTVSAAFSYSQFLRHLVLRSASGAIRFGESLAELGPGSSLGFGLAALIAGASRYASYDVVSHFDVATNLRVFDEMVELFAARAPIPHEGEFVRIFPYVDDHAFPSVLSPDWMHRALAPDRLARVRADILAKGGPSLSTHTGPFTGPAPRRVDWVASHSVLEHVDDLEGIYRLIASLMGPDAVMTHLIDFSSHGLTEQWNGHLTLKDAQWTILRGRRTYLINRQPLSAHLRLIAAHGFTVLDQRLHRRVDGRLKESFVPRFGEMSATESTIHMAFLVCRSHAAAKAGP